MGHKELKTGSSNLTPYPSFVLDTDHEADRDETSRKRPSSLCEKAAPDVPTRTLQHCLCTEVRRTEFWKE